jgi:hypothetical protein
MKHQIELTKDFFFGGRAKFTVESEKTSQWRTYRIGRMDPTPRFPNPGYALTLLAGPDNENSFVYIGMVNPETGELRLTKNSRRNDSSPDVIIFRWLMGGAHSRITVKTATGESKPYAGGVFGDNTLAGGQVHHEGKCGCCGRTLTVPESIKRGIGPECWSRMGMAA